MTIDNFFAELKRRNVYRVAVAYAVVSWLVLQAASLFFTSFEAPPWATKVFIVAVVLGFPIALVLSWAFEITPEGVKLESEIDPNKSITRGTGRKIVAVTIALAVVAAGLFVYQRVRPAPRSILEGGAPAAPGAPDLAGARPDLGQAYARQGKADEAGKVLARLREQAKSQYVSPYAFAVVLAALGEKAHAINELERGYDDAGFYISLVKVDPLFDDLRGDPRFEALVQKITCGK